MMTNSYPFVDELITDAQGRVVKVVMDLPRYQALIDAIEDAALLRAMQEAERETPLSRDAALRELDAHRRDGQNFLVMPEQSVDSPLDIDGVDLGVTSEEIVALIHEGRRRD